MEEDKERRLEQDSLSKLIGRQCPVCNKHLDAILDLGLIGLRIKDIAYDGHYWKDNITFNLQCGHQVSLQMGEGRFWLESM
jgi:hypothetical protein